MKEDIICAAGAIAALAVLLLVACSSPPTVTATQQPVDQISDGVTKFCDYGRAVYVFEGAAGGIAVVPGAGECVQP